MILKRLSLRNFLVFYGEQRFDFPADRDRNLVLILANNNTGKTCIIQALRFLFYGDISRSSDGQQSGDASVVNDRAVHEAAPGETVAAHVELTLEIDGKELTYRRSIATSKTAGGDRTSERAYLERKNEHERTYVGDSSAGAFQAGISRMVPKGLFDAFYFQGEPLNGRLLEGVGAIQGALSGIIHTIGPVPFPPISTSICSRP